MLINGVPVKEYGAKQLTVDFTPSTQEKTYEWNAGARLPIMVENRATFKKATILLKVTGGSRQEINKNASHLHKLAAGETQYILDGYKGWVFVGVLESEPTLKKTIDPGVYKMTLQVKGYMRDEKQQEADINRNTKGYVFVEGTRDTPLMIEITPVIDLPEFSIYGVAKREITIRNMTKDSTVYIDGLTGLVTENGQNKFNDVVMFEFPYLEPGEQIVSFSENVCNVKIRYYPMWI